MKLLILFLVVGMTQGAVYELLDSAEDELVVDFIAGMEAAPSLKDTLGISQYDSALEKLEYDIKTEIANAFRKVLENIMQQIRELAEKGSAVSKELLGKLKNVLDTLKAAGTDLTERTKEILNKLKGELSEQLREMLKEIGFINYDFRDMIISILEKMNIRHIVEKIKDFLVQNLDMDTIINLLTSFFPGNPLVQTVIGWLLKLGIEGLKLLVRRMLGYKDLDAYFSRDLLGDSEAKNSLLETLNKLGQWIRRLLNSGIENIKGKLEKVKDFVPQFVESLKKLSKEAAQELVKGLEPFRELFGGLVGDVIDEIKRKLDI